MSSEMSEMDKILQLPITRILNAFLSTSDEEIESIINKLNSKSSNGYDGISTKFVKKYKDKLIYPLRKHINKCFVTGIYPESLKIGTVEPIFKSGDRTNCTNYRPITKLSAIDKIFEQAILNRLQKHFEKNNIILHKNQFGFTKNCMFELR